MGKRKIPFNTDDMFLDGQHTPQEKQAFVSSRLFAPAVAVYNTTDKRLRVSRITQSGKDTHVVMTTPEGFSVCSLNYNDENGAYSFRTTTDGDRSFVGGSRDIYTTSVTYLCSKLSKSSKHPAKSSLDICLAQSPMVVDRAIRHAVDRTVDTIMGTGLVRRPHLTLEASIATFLAEIAMGKTTMQQMSAEMRSSFEAQYADYINKSDKFDGAVDGTKSAFANGMWLFISDINGGVIFGAVNSDGLNGGLDSYKNNDRLPGSEHHKYASYVMTPKWYPSRDAIPEEYRRELEYSLMLLKVHRKSDDLIPNTSSEVWTEIGAAKYGNIMLLPR